MTAWMSALSPRIVLRLDGLLCLVMGGALIGLRGVLAELTGLTPGFLTAAGAILVPVGVFILAVSAQAATPRLGVMTVVGGNLAWVLASIGVVVSGLVAPTPVGMVLILGQAAAVAVIAAVEARWLMTPQAAQA